MRAIVVTDSLDWRLHGFDLLSEHQPATGFEWPLEAATWMVGAQYKPAEVAWSSNPLFTWKFEDLKQCVTHNVFAGLSRHKPDNSGPCLNEAPWSDSSAV